MSKPEEPLDLAPFDAWFHTHAGESIKRILTNRWFLYGLSLVPGVLFLLWLSLLHAAPEWRWPLATIMVGLLVVHRMLANTLLPRGNVQTGPK